MDGALSKKLPPLRGGGEVSWGAEGFDLDEIEPPRRPLLGKAVGAGCEGGGFTDPDDGKLSPLKASVRPPKESC